MKTTATTIAAAIAAFLIGLSCAAKPDPFVKSVESYPEYRAKVAECDSLSFALNQAREAQLTAENKLAEFKAKPPEIIREPADTTEVESLRVQLAAKEAEVEKLLATIQEDRAELLKKSNQCQPMSQSYLYNPRPRLFVRLRK